MPSVGRRMVAGRRPALRAAGYGAVVLLTLLPVWLVSYFPSQDGPIHLLIAHVARNYDAPGAALLRTYFAPNAEIEPNFAVYLLLDLFAPLTDPATAEKLLVSLLAILFALAGIYAVGSIDRRAWPLSLLFLPLIFGRYLHLGFYNFVLSLIGFLLVFSYWLRHRSELTWLRLLVLATAALALVFVHLVGLVVLVYAVGVSSLVLWLHARPRPSWQELGREWLGLGAACLPALLVAASFVLRHDPHAEALQSEAWLLRNLLSAKFLFSFSRVEPVLALPWLLAALALAAWTLRAGGLRDGLALALLASLGGLVLIYFLVPLSIRGVPLAGRLVPFMALLGILWLANGYLAATPRLRRIVLLGAVSSTLLLAAQRAISYREVDEHTREYLAAARRIEPHSTLLPINFWGGKQLLAGERSAWLTDPFLHLGARIALATDGVYLRAPLLSSAIFGYFPIVYRPELDPFRVFDKRALEPKDSPPRFVDLASYDDRTPGRLDYVLLWPMTPEVAREPTVEAIVDRLSQRYQRVDVPSGRGLVHLYRRRDTARSAPAG